MPNKLASWLLGKPLMSLIVSVKPYTPKSKICSEESPHTPDYIQLQERMDNGGELHVNYRKEGWYIYSRSDDGNLGFERPSNRKEQQGVMYSESLKTLKSSILNKPLPNKVTEWLYRYKCLAFIVTPKNIESECRTHMDENARIEESTEDAIRWTYQDRS